ncbi:hypothetical protein Agub_g8885 [Astrephomene gubernaculifera]|uniref:RAP domain-containing protein n=1 Tax=Astrephomene gubernaculifera TaxID=47775 RepID=A0AAD3DSF4_9CHLO|nr:hypothetical protein Agub_g8885 [Astrephomene gubernaculifera]
MALLPSFEANLGRLTRSLRCLSSIPCQGLGSGIGYQEEHISHSGRESVDFCGSSTSHGYGGWQLRDAKAAHRRSTPAGPFQPIILRGLATSAGRVLDTAAKGVGDESSGSASSSRGSSSASQAKLALDAAQDLPSLLRLVEAGAKEWPLSLLVAAFGKAVSGADTPQTSTHLLHRTLQALSAAYLPHLNLISEPQHAIIPLHTCARAGYWDGPLPAQLLARLARHNAELLRLAGTGREHVQLWSSLSAAPEHLLRSAAAADVAVLLPSSAACLIRMSASASTAQKYGLSEEDCAELLAACARLAAVDAAGLLGLGRDRGGAGGGGAGGRVPVTEELCHRLTACLAGAEEQHQQRDRGADEAEEAGEAWVQRSGLSKEEAEAAGRRAARAWVALGELSERCGHAPEQRSLHALAKRVARLVRASGSSWAGMQRASTLRSQQQQQQSEWRWDELRDDAEAGEEHNRGSGDVGGGGQPLDPQLLVDLLDACVKLGFSEPALLKPLAAGLAQAREPLDGSTLVRVLRSLTELGCRGPALRSLFAEVHLRLQEAKEDIPAPDPNPDGDVHPPTEQQQRWQQRQQRQQRWQQRQQLKQQQGPFPLPALVHLLCALERWLPLLPEGASETAEAVALVDLAAQECRRRSDYLRTLTAEQLSHAAWALSKMRYDRQGWYEAAASAAARPRFRAAGLAQDWSRLWYALAVVRHWPDVDLLGAMVRDLPPRWKQQHQQLLEQQRSSRAYRASASGSSASSTSAAETAAATTAAAAAVTPLSAIRTGASVRDCASLLWSLAVLGLYEKRLVDVLSERLGVLLPLGRTEARLMVKVRDLAMCLWALAVMGPEAISRHCGLVEELLREVVRRWDSNAAFTPKDMQMLWQAQQELEFLAVHKPHAPVAALRGILVAGAAEGSGAGGAGAGAGDEGKGSGGGGEGGGDAGVPGTLLYAMRHATESVRQKSAQRMQLNKTLQALQHQQQKQLQEFRAARNNNRRPSSWPAPAANGIIRSIKPNHPLEGLHIRVDALVEFQGGRRVAVEAVEAAAYLSNWPHSQRKSGSAKLRHRQLRRVFAKCDIVEVPSWEWWAVMGGPEERQRYLAEKLGLDTGVSGGWCGGD